VKVTEDMNIFHSAQGNFSYYMKFHLLLCHLLGYLYAVLMGLLFKLRKCQKYERTCSLIE